MKEELLYNVWKYKLFNTRHLKTIQGEPIDILFGGEHNTNSGPDFSNARLRIGTTQWAGNVEVHVKTSDWLQHKHQDDKAFKTVILHVVYEHDKDIDDSVPVLELKHLVAAHTIVTYQNITEDKNPIPCNKLLPHADHFTWLNWMDRLAAERLQSKVSVIDTLLQSTKQHWEEAFYRTLARYLGGKVNNDAMLMLTEHLPLNVVSKHKQDILQIEALLFGVAGFLEDEKGDEYYMALQKEYNFLKAKYTLHSINKATWKFMRMRPANFPTIRIAQLAMLIHQSSHLLSKLIETTDITVAHKFFNVTPSGYWDTHYQFGEASAMRKKTLGKTTVEALFINTIIPFIFHYGRLHARHDIQERALEWLSKLPAEKNTIIDKWNLLGKKALNAADSQAMLHLYQNYCTGKRCLQCAIGIELLRDKP